jgi:hypothetical protein
VKDKRLGEVNNTVKGLEIFPVLAQDCGNSRQKILTLLNKTNEPEYFQILK